MNNTVIPRIQQHVQAGLPELAPSIREWLEGHLIVPYRTEVYADWNTDARVTVWIVTDHTGHNDSNCRVVFHETTDGFGLEQTLLVDNGERAVYMGSYGTFAETIDGM